MPAPLPWPSALTGTPAVSVLERAIERQRLAHSLLLHGENLGTLATVAHAIADRLLNDSRHKAQYFPPKQHPDFFALRPSGKARYITADDLRDLIDSIQMTPRISARKVAVIYEADRMRDRESSIFLKTLEEPPSDTTIVLITCRPYTLTTTILSRCLHFRFTDDGAEALAESADTTRQAWREAKAAYQAWLARCIGAATDKRAVAGQILGLYGLVTRFNSVLHAATKEAWEHQKEKLPADLDDDEVDAIQTGIANGIRLKLFSELEHATRAFAQERLLTGDATARRALTAAVRQLEHSASLLRLNLNEATALENFLLESLRIWTLR